MRTKNLLSGVVVASLLAGVTQGATFRYRSGGDWSTVTDGPGEGWGLNPNNGGVSPGPGLPGGSDDARINWGGSTVTVTTVVPTVNRVQIGVDESGVLVVENEGVLSTAGTNGDLLAGNNNTNATGTLTVNNGGVVNVGRILWAANGGSDGVININAGGTVDVTSHLWWGVSGEATVSIAGTLTQNGGNLGLGTSDGQDTGYGGLGAVAMVSVQNGGLLALNNISASGGSIQTGSLLTIEDGGQLTLPGDFVGNVGNYITAGKIVGGGGAALKVDLTTNPGFTTVSVIPEPSVVSLLGIVGIGGLLRRRRRG